MKNRAAAHRKKPRRGRRLGSPSYLTTEHAQLSQRRTKYSPPRAGVPPFGVVPVIVELDLADTGRIQPILGTVTLGFGSPMAGLKTG